MHELTLALGALSLNININFLNLTDDLRNDSRLNFLLLSGGRFGQLLLDLIIGLWVRISLSCAQKQSVCDLTIVVGRILLSDRRGWLGGVGVRNNCWGLFSKWVHRVNFFGDENIESLFREGVLLNFEVTGWAIRLLFQTLCRHFNSRHNLFSLLLLIQVNYLLPCLLKMVHFARLLGELR